MTSIGIARKELGRFVLRCRATTLPLFYRSAATFASPGINTSLVRVYKPPMFFQQPCSVASDKRMSTHTPRQYYVGFLCIQLLDMLAGIYAQDIQHLSLYILGHYDLLQSLETILKIADVDFGMNTENLMERVKNLPTVTADKLTDILLGLGLFKLADKIGLKIPTGDNKSFNPADNKSFQFDVVKAMKFEIQKVHIDHLNVYGPTVYFVIKDMEMSALKYMEEKK